MLKRILTVAVLVSGLAGCSAPKLEQSKDYEMDAGSYQDMILDKQSKPQKITVEFSSTAGSVTVGAYKAEDAKNITNTDPKKALTEQNGKQGTLNFEVPANTETHIIIGSNGKTQVKVSVTNQK